MKSKLCSLLVATIAHNNQLHLVKAFSVAKSAPAEAAVRSTKETQTLGLLTFDLDDTLYPIDKVEEEANEAFVKAMKQYGYDSTDKSYPLAPSNIVHTAQQIRDELSQINPDKAASLTHTELRLQAIRREMEKVTVSRKLQACADDWATNVDALSPLVVENAKKWAKAAVNQNIVNSISTLWEMERHHSAERHLYPEVIDILKQIQQDHPEAIIGAVTDGRSNPLLMTFTLAPFFDFRCSWEDDQGTARRQKFFQELEETRGDTSQLSWIYDEARFKYAELRQAKDTMAALKHVNVDQPLTYPETYDDRVWIHVGDDLAFDVGGSAACGAKTIHAKLADKYGQTARHRYYDEVDEDDTESTTTRASWSTTPQKELRERNEMAKAALEKVDVTINFLTRLPEAINDILQANDGL